jgi:hypothetical protein
MLQPSPILWSVWIANFESPSVRDGDFVRLNISAPCRRSLVAALRDAEAMATHPSVLMVDLVPICVN